MNPAFGEFMSVIGSGLLTTIGLCVWMLKSVQKNQERNERRVEKITDRYIESMEARDKAMTDALEKISHEMGELREAINSKHN